MPYEVELKFVLEHGSGLEGRLQKMDAKPGETEFQVDTYYQHPSRDFSQTDEAMRIRSVGSRNILTFKGPLLDTETKTRLEQEVEFESGDAGREAMCQILASNGYRPVINVEKQRQVFHLNWQKRDFEIAFDRVTGLGEYVEIETMTDEAQRASATIEIQRLAEELGLKRQERRGYLRLLLEQQEGES